MSFSAAMQFSLVASQCVTRCTYILPIRSDISEFRHRCTAQIRKILAPKPPSRCDVSLVSSIDMKLLRSQGGLEMYVLTHQSGTRAEVSASFLCDAATH